MAGVFLPPEPVLAAAALMFGLVVGSFANVVIHRLPLGQSIVFPPSRCPGCLAAIRPWQNVPVLSWCLLRGRCASCREPISARYPVVEAIHGLGFALVILRFGPTPFAVLLLLFFFALVVLAFIDWDHQILPDVITLPGVVAGILGAFLPGAMVSWQQAGLGAAFGYVLFFLVAETYARLRGIEGLGQGDWKLAAMMGAFFGVQRLLLVVFLGSLWGLVYGLVQATGQRRASGADRPDEAPLAPEPEGPAIESPSDSPGAPSVEVTETEAPVSIGKFRLPFGTFLAAAGLFVLLLGDPVLAWYGSFFR